jgi:tripartite-type tricarboxylate transporter receptor subunit TctC
VPTFVDAGLKDFVVASGVGVLAPTKTPRPIVDQLQKAVVAVLHDPAVRDRYSALGIEVVGNTPEQFGQQIRVDLARWGEVVNQANIRAD